MIKIILQMLQPWKWFAFNKKREIDITPKKDSQMVIIRDYLEENGIISSMYAKDQKLHRLKKEIYQLRKMGYVIKTQFFYFNGTRHVHYTLLQTPLMKHELGI